MQTKQLDGMIMKHMKEEQLNFLDVHPRTSHKGPEGKLMYISTLSLTSALDGGGWSTLHPGCFTPGKDMVPIL
jgi:hypothetical protein